MASNNDVDFNTSMSLYQRVTILFNFLEKRSRFGIGLLQSDTSLTKLTLFLLGNEMLDPG